MATNTRPGQRIGQRKTTKPSAGQPKHRVRAYDGLIPEDAPFDILIVPTVKDIMDGVPGDASQCALVKTAERLYGSQVAHIGTTRAIIDMPDALGNRHLYRFVVPTETRTALRKFDETGVMPIGGFLLKKPTKSATHKARQEYNDRRDKVVLADFTPVKPYGTRKQPYRLVGTRDGRIVGRGSKVVKSK